MPVEVYRNIMPNPRAVAAGAAVFGAVSSGLGSFITNLPGDVPTARRWTRTGNGTARAVVLDIGIGMYADGRRILALMEVEASEDHSLAIVRARPDTLSSAGEVTLWSGTLTKGRNYIVTNFAPTFTAVATATSGIILVINDGSLTETIDATKFLISDKVTDWFDGDSPTLSLPDYSWVGTPGASSSIASMDLPVASKTDWEMAWLAAHGGSGLTLDDRRSQVLMPNPFAYWSGLSGLTPAQLWSLSDHRRKVMQTALGLTDVQAAQLSDSDIALRYWKL